MPETSYKREQVVEILGSVLNRVNKQHPMDTTLLKDVTQLKTAVDNLRSELAVVHPDHIQSHIPGATDELDAIVATTEQATFSIMGACEAIQGHLVDKPLEESAPIENEIIRIVEACTFQDLTGQRISKIIRALGEIDQRSAELSDVLNECLTALAGTAVGTAPKGDGLLNGPALPAQGMTQEDIDKLLNDF